MPITATDIVNRGLLLIGSRPLSANLGTDQTDTGVRAEILYDQARQFVFAMHPWNCLVTRETLEEESPQPDEYEQFGKAYELPEDFIRLIAITPSSKNYRIESKRIIQAGGGDIQIVYIRDEDDPDEWDVLLREVVAARFAFDMVLAQMGSSESQERTYRIFEERMADARFADSQQHDWKERIQAEVWADARFTNVPPDEYFPLPLTGD